MTEPSAANLLHFAVWAAPAAAILLAWASHRTRTAAPEGVGAFCGLASAAFVLSIAAGYALSVFVHRDSPATVLWVSVAAGAGGMLLAIAIAGRLMRGHASQGLPSAAAAADAAAGTLGVALLLAAYVLLRHSMRPVEWSAAVALGAALVAAIFPFAATALGRKAEDELAVRILPFCHLCAAGVCLLVAGVLLGPIGFGQALRHSGGAMVSWLALAAIVWFALRLAQMALPSGSRVICVLLFLLFVAACALMVPLVVPAGLSQRWAASLPPCLWMGLGAGCLAALVHSMGFSAEDSPYLRQSAVLLAVVVVCAGAASLRLLQGFGAVCAGAGMLAAVFGWSLLAPLRADRHCVCLLPPALLWGPAFLSVTAALRIWRSMSEGPLISMLSPYPFLALAIGACVPWAVWMLTSAQPGERRTGGAAVAASVFAVVMLAAAIVLVTTVFGEPSLRMFLAGLGAGCLSWGMVSEALPGAASAPVVSAVLVSATAVLSGGLALMNAGGAAERAQKVQMLSVCFGTLAVVAVLMEVWRAVSSRRTRSA